MLFGRALDFVDIFPRKPMLNVKTSEKFPTRTGGVLTLLVFGITFAQSIMTLITIFQYSSPQITTAKSYQKYPTTLNLDDEGFVFGVKLLNEDYDLASSYITFHLTAVNIKHRRDGTVATSYENIPLRKCTLDYLSEFELEFISAGLNTALCPAGADLKIGGTYLNDNYDFLVIYASPCKNDTNQPDIICKPIEEIRTILERKSLEVQLLYSNTMIDPSNHTAPVRRFLAETYWTAMPNFTTTSVDVLINEQSVVTDDNIWFAGWNTNTTNTYQIDMAESRTQQAALDRDDDDTFRILNITMKRSSNLYTTTRVFSKITTGLSTIGGIYSLMVSIFGAFAALFTKRLFMINLANELYEFDLTGIEEDSRSCCRRRKRTGKYAYRRTESKHGESGSIINRSSANFSIWAQKFSKYLSGNRRKLDYSFWDFLMGTCCCCMKRKKDKLIEKAIQIVDHDIDILQLLKKTQDAERLQRVLLSEDQQNIFSYSRPPLITLDPEEEAPTPAKRKNSHHVREASSPSRRRNEGDTGRNKRRRRANRAETIRSSRRAQLFVEYDKNFDNIDKFMTLCRSYERLFRNHHKSLNFKLMQSLDWEMHETLFDVVREVRQNPIVAGQYYKAVAKKIFSELYKERQSPKVLTKLEAGVIISRKLRILQKSRMRKKKEKRMNSVESGDETSKQWEGDSPGEIRITLGVQATHNPLITEEDGLEEHLILDANMGSDQGPREDTLTREQVPVDKEPDTANLLVSGEDHLEPYDTKSVSSSPVSNQQKNTNV